MVLRMNNLDEGDPPKQRVIDKIRAIRGLARSIINDSLYKECTKELEAMRADSNVKILMGQLPITHDDAFHF